MSYFLSFPRQYDLLVKNLRFLPFYPPQFRLKPYQGVSPGPRI